MSRGVDKAIRITVGLFVCAFFGYSQYVELKTPPPHALHIALFSAGFLVGAAVIFPKLTVILKQFLGLYREGRRWTDPQPPKDGAP